MVKKIIEKLFNIVILKKEKYNYLVHFKDSNTGLYAIDKNPKDIDYQWIVNNNFRIK